MQIKVLVIAAILFFVGPVAAAVTQTPPSTDVDCTYLTTADPYFEAEGILTLETFAGPPNYENIEDGDAEERVFILQLSEPRCADDGEFIFASSEPFREIHISFSDQAMLERLRTAVGHDVKVRGSAYGAFNAHHRAPLVMFVEDVSIPLDVPNEQEIVMMNLVDAAVRMPKGSRSLSAYARHYADDGNGHILAVFLLPPVPPSPSPGCTKTQSDGSLRKCSEAEVIELNAREESNFEAYLISVGTAGERRWHDSADDLPLIFDGGCEQVSIVYQISSGKVLQANCNGVA